MLSQKLKLQQWRSTAKNVADRALILAKFLCFLHIADTYLCSPTLVHGPSMLPTLNMRGDVVLTERVSHRIGNVGVGDVVLVVSPENPRKMITKRVVAREGDRVSVLGDGIWGDVSRSFVVPKGHVWVQGDNPYQSRDSRIFGPVPYGLIKGRVFFRAKFKWDAEHAQAVFMEFKRKCMKRLIDTAHKAAKCPADHLPSWLSPEMHSAFPEAHSDPSFKKRSNAGKANRRKLGDGVGTHYQGSMSTAELVKKMTEELRRVSTPSEVYLRSRSKKQVDDSDEVSFIDDRCSQAWEKFQELRTLQEDGEGSQNSERSPPSETELFLEATDGFLLSGTVLGLGSATQLFYEKPIRGKSSSVSSSSSRAVSDLKEQIEIQRRLLEEANQRVEADRAAHAKELEETKKQMEGNMREMEDLKRMVRKMMVNLTPSMSCNPFNGSEMQPPSQP